MRLDLIADAVGVEGVVGQHDGAWIELINDTYRNGFVMGLARGQAEPGRGRLGIDDRVNLGREATSEATKP